MERVPFFVLPAKRLCENIGSHIRDAVVDGHQQQQSKKNYPGPDGARRAQQRYTWLLAPSDCLGDEQQENPWSIALNGVKANIDLDN